MPNSKKKWKILFFIAFCILISGIFEYMLIPYAYIRVDVHNIEVNQYDDLYVGTSHGKCGINPLTVDKETGRKSTNLCLGGEYLQDSYYLVKEASRHHKPKRIIYELDPGYWVTEPSQATDYNLIYREFPLSLVKAEYYVAKILAADFRNTLFSWYTCREQYTSIPTIVKTKQSDEYKKYGTKTFKGKTQSYEKEGFIHINVLDGVEKTRDNLMLWDESKVFKGNLKYFKKLAKYCRRNKIELVAITTPIPAETLEQYPDQYAEANTYFTNLMSQYNIQYYNFNYMEDDKIDRSMEAFSDYDGHMYGRSAEKFSQLLGQYLK